MNIKYLEKLIKILSQMTGPNIEAILFDSRLYIIKAILAIATGYLIGKSMPLTRLDMISVLLGGMYNLEPINIFGIKGGLSQLVTSTLGAACTGILIAILSLREGKVYFFLFYLPKIVLFY